eukprot:613383-Rhodomonas_salina.2
MIMVCPAESLAADLRSQAAAWPGPQPGTGRLAGAGGARLTQGSCHCDVPGGTQYNMMYSQAARQRLGQDRRTSPRLRLSSAGLSKSGSA